MLDYNTLPAPLRAFLGKPTDPFVVRLLSQDRAWIVAEAEHRARGAWACNEREAYAAWRALADIARDVVLTRLGWGREEYLSFRGVE